MGTDPTRHPKNVPEAYNLESGHTAHPKNVPGDFYVEHGCCTACGIPEVTAPDHFTFDDDGQCYVKKQPSNSTETDLVLEAMRTSEVRCIRYRGRDPAIFARLGAMGEPELCDFPPAEGIPVLFRNHVVFGGIDRPHADPEEAIADFRSFWMGGPEPPFPEYRHKFRRPRRWLLRRDLSFEISWYQDRYHRIDVSNVAQDTSRVVMFHLRTETAPSRGLSSTLDRWLAQSKRFGRQQWYTAEERSRGTGGS